MDFHFLGGWQMAEFDTWTQTVCVCCYTTYDLHYNYQDWLSWKAGEYIQDVMPYLSADDRELMISGVCGKCFDMMFPLDIEWEDDDACDC